MKKLMDSIKKFYSTKIISKMLLTLAAVLVIVLICVITPILFVGSTKLPVVSGGELSSRGEAIAKDAGVVELASKNGRKLSIDTKTMAITLDNGNGMKWSSAVKGAVSPDETALLNLTYLGEDDSINIWNSYDYCTALGGYELYRIEDGVAMDLTWAAGESAAYYEYMPKKMDEARYNDFFIAGIEGLKADGTISEDRYNTFLQTFTLLYKYSGSEGCYVITYIGTPPVSAVTQMIELTKLLGYTQEMLVADSAEFGIVVSFAEPANFNMTVEITLSDEGMKVRIPSSAIVSGNSFYKVQNIEVLPNFGATEFEKAENGFMLIPDGVGAIMEFDKGSTEVIAYKRPVYDNDFYKDYYFQPEYSDELMMPVFGMCVGHDGKKDGFVAVIENGAETSYIHTKQAGKDSGGANYNKIYTSVDFLQYASTKVYGPYSTNNTHYLVSTGNFNLDYTLEYRFAENISGYYDLAKAYQNYLIETGDFTYGNFNDKDAYIEAVGSVTLTERFIGIPYSKVKSLTSYDELTGILTELNKDNLYVTYLGAFNGGLSNKLSNRANLVSENGSKKSLSKLEAYAADNDISLALGTNLAKVYVSGNGFAAGLHAIKDYANINVLMYRYCSAVGVLSGYVNSEDKNACYNILAPEYLTKAIDGFTKDFDYDTNLFIQDLGNIYYADYDNSDMTDVYTANEVLDNALAKVGTNGLWLSNPVMSRMRYAEVATDISRTSSDYRTFTETVPFRTLVLNGITRYTTTDINLSSKKPEFFILQAAELGSIPKFKITSKLEDELKGSSYNDWYCVSYERVKGDLEYVLDECAKINSEIGCKEISDHSSVMGNVFKTVYSNGKEVYTNYNLYDVELEEGMTIPALGYVIK